jgi:hypothetical protein
MAAPLAAIARKARRDSLLRSTMSSLLSLSSVHPVAAAAPCPSADDLVVSLRGPLRNGSSSSAVWTESGPPRPRARDARHRRLNGSSMTYRQVPSDCLRITSLVSPLIDTAEPSAFDGSV